jgi:hypothetical protein
LSTKELTKALKNQLLRFVERDLVDQFGAIWVYGSKISLERADEQKASFLRQECCLPVVYRSFDRFAGFLVNN